MSNRRTDDWITSYLQYVENSEPPQLFKEWCAVSTIAAALQRKCKMEWGTTTFYPNLYVVLTAPAGKARKGTAMSSARRFINKIGIPLSAEAVTREALIRTLKESETVLPTENGVLVHSSLTVFSPELTVFLGYNNLQLMSDLTDWFDCAEKWVYRTKNAGTDDISGVYINLLGATTPDLIRSTLPIDAIGGGLTSRMIFVFEERKGKIVPFPFISEKMKKLEKDLYYDIEKIHMLGGVFKVTDNFLKYWGDWYTAQEDKNPFNTDLSIQHLGGYIERRPTQVLKLSMVMNASRSGTMVLDRCDLERAIDLLTRTEVKMPLVFGGMGQGSSAALTYSVERSIAVARDGILLNSVIGRHRFEGTATEIGESVDTLVRAGLARLENTKDGPRYYPTDKSKI